MIRLGEVLPWRPARRQRRKARQDEDLRRRSLQRAPPRITAGVALNQKPSQSRRAAPASRDSFQLFKESGSTRTKPPMNRETVRKPWICRSRISEGFKPGLYDCDVLQRISHGRIVRAKGEDAAIRPHRIGSGRRESEGPRRRADHTLAQLAYLLCQGHQRNQVLGALLDCPRRVPVERQISRDCGAGCQGHGNGRPSRHFPPVAQTSRGLTRNLSDENTP